MPTVTTITDAETDAGVDLDPINLAYALGRLETVIDLALWRSR